MRLRTLGMAMGLLAWAGAAAADDLETMAMRQVRLSTDPAVARGCTRLVSVSDDSAKDLRKKIVRAGGNVAVVQFGVAEMSMIYADVYRCPAAAPPAPPPLPPGVPPPPPGPPPPPPPDPSR